MTLDGELLFMRKYIEAGIITRPHGINGAVKADSWCDSAEIFAGLKKLYLEDKASKSGYRALNVIKSSIQQNRVIFTLEGFSTVEAAEGLRNKTVFACRNDIPIPEGAYLIDDLKGLPIIDSETGEIYGALKDVIQGPGGNLYEVRTNKGTVLIPAVKEFIKKTDLEKGIFVSPIGGMFDEN